MRAADRLIAAAEDLAAGFLALVTALTFVSVLLRYFLNRAIPDSYDLSRNLLGILIFWGIAIAGFRGDHIVVDLVWSALPSAGKRALDWLATLFTLGCMAVFAWAMADKVAGEYRSGEATYDMHLPVWPFYLLAWVGIAASVLLLLVRFVRQFGRADAATALGQLCRAATPPDAALLAGRQEFWHAMSDARRSRLVDLERPNGDVITGEFLTACIRKFVDADTIVLNEGISHYHTIIDHLTLTRPGSLFASGGGSLGWNGGAAIGVKLARPDKTVIALCGDGSYMFSVPSTVHWMARQYRTPFLQVVYNNRGWKSPKLSALAVHPDGYASRANDIGVAFDPPPDYAGIAAASGGAFARTVHRAAELEPALEAAMHAVRVEGRAAVLDVWLPHL